MKKGQTLKGEIEKLQGGPKQYQQGYSEFYKLKFFLTLDVLIPRPETELLVDAVIKLSEEIALSKTPRNDVFASGAKQSITAMDIGTGSGAIAISVAKNLPKIKVIATDISEKALEVARKNAKLHKVQEQIIFLESDLLSAFQLGVVKQPDIIVANLPYIPTAKLMYVVDPLVSDFEPRIALDGGRDGFEIYRKLFAQMVEKKFYPKYLLIEIDDTQSAIAPLEAKRHFPDAKIEVKKDLAKKDRFLVVKF